MRSSGSNISVTPYLRISWITDLTLCSTGFDPQLVYTSSMGTELKTILIMSLARTLPSWMYLSKSVSGLSLRTLVIHCWTLLSSSRSLLVLNGLFFARGSLAAPSALAFGKQLAAGSPLSTLAH